MFNNKYVFFLRHRHRGVKFSFGNTYRYVSITLILEQVAPCIGSQFGMRFVWSSAAGFINWSGRRILLTGGRVLIQGLC